MILANKFAKDNGFSDELVVVFGDNELLLLSLLLLLSSGCSIKFGIKELRRLLPLSLLIPALVMADLIWSPIASPVMLLILLIEIDRFVVEVPDSENGGMLQSVLLVVGLMIVDVFVAPVSNWC